MKIVILLILAMNLSTNISAAEYQFKSTIDRVIPLGKKFEDIDLNENDSVEGVIELDRKDRYKSVYEGMYFWGFSVTKFIVNSPLNIHFQGGDLTVNQTLEQTTLSCVKRNSGPCGITGPPLKSFNLTNSSVELYSPVEYLLTQPGLKNPDIDFQEAVDHFLGNIIKGDTKVILKFLSEENPNDYVRVILNITEVKNTDAASPKS